MSAFRYLSVCSGIEAASVAWHPLGWEPAAFSEIEPFPRAVLAHHYPDVPLHGDFTTIQGDEYGPVHLLVGGTPCQDFSVAGLRKGLAGERGNLTLEFFRLAERVRPRWVVWENVPGVLSQDKGRAFGAILGGLVELGYGFAYRVLDAQFIRVDGFARAVPQRRRRVFVVGYLGDWRRAAAVLFERESLSGHPAPRRSAGEGTAYPTAISVALRGRDEGGACELGDDVGHTLRASTGGGDKPHAMVAQSLLFGGHSNNPLDENLVAHALRGEGFDASEDGTGRGTPLVPVASSIETMYGVNHADAAQTGPDQALRALRDAVGEEAYSEWGTGVVVALRAQEILRSGVHGKSVRCAPHVWDRLGDDTLSRSQADGAGLVRALWKAGCDGCPPQGWQPSERLAQELGTHLSLLSHQRASAARFLLGLWRASEGLGFLREALSALQEAWRPAQDADQSAQVASPFWRVRRLTPTECERLMGFPDRYTDVPFRGKPAADGPRYKALGNSMAVNAMRWIGQRIDAVEHLAPLSQREAA